MPAILLSLLPLLAKFAPDLIGLAFGGNAEAVAGKVEAAVRDIFGTTEPDQVSAAVAADPAKADALKARLDAETANVKAALLDVQDARQTELAFVKAASPLQWAVPVLGAFVTLGFVAATLAAATHAIDQGPMAVYLITTLGAGFLAVMGYFFGSSAGSKSKDDILAKLATPTLPNLSIAKKTTGR